MNFATSYAPLAGFTKSHSVPSLKRRATSSSPLRVSLSTALVDETSTIHVAQSAKRRKVEVIVIDDSGSDEEDDQHTVKVFQDVQAQRKRYKNCLRQQVLPHISRAVKQLSPDKYHIDNIAVEASSRVAKSATFASRFKETNGLLTAKDEAYIADMVPGVIRDLCALPSYQTPLTPESFGSPEPLTNPHIASHLSQIANDLLPSPSPSFSPLNHQPATPPDIQPQKRQRKPLRLRQGPILPSRRLYLHLESRPYIGFDERQAVANGARLATRQTLRNHSVPDEPIVYHVDFTDEEIEQMTTILRQRHVPSGSKLSLLQFCSLFNVPSIINNHLPGRSKVDVSNFCRDLKEGNTVATPDAKVLSLKKTEQCHTSCDDTKMASLLLARELEGNRGFGRTRRYVNFQGEFRRTLEDGLGLRAEFTNCAGDIFTTSWVSKSAVLCGTTTHSDAANQQYNKPGNLLLCSTSCGELRAFDNHRIPRPTVVKGDNSTDAMRESQDPWLYSSVVASDYDAINDIAYTCSFDGTVKVWRVTSNGQSMQQVANWQHDGRVNLVVAASDGSGLVASASHTADKAIRVYTLDKNDPSNSKYISLSGNKNEIEATSKWAYVPATMQWGRAPGTQHLLLVGYSARSFTDDDDDIPEDKQKSGEILLWDTRRGRSVPVLTATTSNVFEVAWHPTAARFIVGTSPCGNVIEQGCKTQVRVFQLDEDGAYAELQTLDCVASDINELTIVPNSLTESYVTAACTDGNVYVWDTAQGDRPIHVLEHGRPLDEVIFDRERYDTGAKFVAWGTNHDRLYTGSSDGVVKVWNIRNQSSPFVRDLIEAPGPITSGSFSPDFSKLVIGDATGRVFFLSVDERDAFDHHYVTLPGSNKKFRRPRPFLPHAEPTPPHASSNDTDVIAVDGLLENMSLADFARKRYLDTQQIILHPNPVIGAIQGPRYGDSKLYRREAHLDNDPSLPLLAQFERHQQEAINASTSSRYRPLRRLPILLQDIKDNARDIAQHMANMDEEEKSALPELEAIHRGRLLRERATLYDDLWRFEYEDFPCTL